MRRVAIFAISLMLASQALAMDGEQVGRIFQECQDAAFEKCGNTSAYCRSYRRSYLKMCLVKRNVPPDYIFMLLNS